MCDFRQIKGKVLKTVDSVHQNVETIEECQNLCLNASYRCFSYDFGDGKTNEKICRTSHLEQASLTHIQDPYLEVKGAVTYEKVSCYKGNNSSLNLECIQINRG